METQPRHHLPPDAGRGLGLGRPVSFRDITVICATRSLLSDLEFVSSLF